MSIKVSDNNESNYYDITPQERWELKYDGTIQDIYFELKDYADGLYTNLLHNIDLFKFTEFVHEFSNDFIEESDVESENDDQEIQDYE